MDGSPKLPPLGLDDYLKGRDKEYGISPEQKLKAAKTVTCLNALQDRYGAVLQVTSGYRPTQITDATPGAVHGDAHERCEGADLHDPDHTLSKWCMLNIEVLIEIGLWMESMLDAEDHCHVQIYAPRSGNRIFRA